MRWKSPRSQDAHRLPLRTASLPQGAQSPAAGGGSCPRLSEVLPGRAWTGVGCGPGVGRPQLLDTRGHRAFHPPRGCGLERPFAPHLWRWTCLWAERALPTCTPPRGHPDRGRPARTDLHRGSSAGPEPGFELRRIRTNLGEVDSPRTARLGLLRRRSGAQAGGRRTLLERKRNKSGVK